MKTKILSTIAFVTLLAAIVGSANAAPAVHANIPFQFTVEGKALPAGQYSFIPSQDETSVRVVPEGKGLSAEALVVTRLAAAIHTTPQDSHIVFDKVGNTYFLSEIWIPGWDGFLLHATKGKHEHQIINVPA